MHVSRPLLASSIVGALAIAAAVAALALQQGDSTSAGTPEGVQLVLLPHETEAGVCRPERIARVNKQETGLHAVYGETRLVDARDETATELPLQLVFSGWNSEGIAEDRVTTGINTETRCADLKILYTVKECLYDETRPEPMACPEIEITGEGFSLLRVGEDRSQGLPQPD
ncbi:hypothetical protein AB2N04_08245 [Nitratireductor sp. GISD-1A_MAKvit]|uniref:hypothetical protein n=1 Tax=Nitratireductor sp. GISD-1A_MAKvit TaxID=3234198 RepID=UPI003465277C